MIQQHSDLPLLVTNQVNTVWIELTSRCNLRCTYCHQSKPDFVGKDMDVDNLDALVADLKQLGVKYAVVQGRGETDVLNGWNVHVDKLLDAGFLLSATMNLARDQTPEEHQTLSRFNWISISVDTIDRELTRKVRRSSDIRQILYNMQRIRGRAIADGRKPPKICWNSVLNDKAVFTLAETVATGVAMGVDKFTLALLSKFVEIPDAMNVYHVTDLSDDKFLEAYDIIQRAIKIGKDANKEVTIHPGLRETLDRKKEEILKAVAPKSLPENEDEIDRAARKGLAGMSVPTHGQTRDCMYPWSAAYIEADRSLRVCCTSPIFKTLSRDWDFAETINGPILQEFRSGFLKGELPRECKLCPIAGITSLDALQGRVEKYLAGEGKAHVVTKA